MGEYKFGGKAVLAMWLTLLLFGSLAMAYGYVWKYKE